jgi:hypothetical protein
MDVRQGDLVARLDQMDLIDDFNGSLHDLSGDVQGLEEVGLTGVETSRTRGDEHIGRSERSGLGGGRHLVVENDLADLWQVAVGEHETHVAHHDGQQSLELGELLTLDEITHDLADQGVLSHEHDGLAAQGETNLLHLVGADVVDSDDEHILVLGDSILQLHHELLLANTTLRHVDLDAIRL